MYIIYTLLVSPVVVSSRFLKHDLFLPREKDPTEKLEQFRVLLKKLPPENYNNLRWVCTHYVSFLTEKCMIQLQMYVIWVKTYLKRVVI